MKHLIVAFTALFGIVAASQASAQNYPTQPITVIVPYGPGGVDGQLRIIQDDLSRILGQPIVIENRAGAGGAIGAQTVQNAKPDGYTLLLAGTSVLTLLPNLQQAPFTYESFAPIGSLSATPLIVAARAETPYNTIQELIQYGKDNPGTVLMASGGTGTSTHVVGEAFQVAAGVKFRHVPFNGIAPAVTGMLSGAGDIVSGLPAPIVTHLQSGKFKALASTGSQRSEFVADVPTLSEAGVEVVENTRFGLFAPEGTAPEVIARLEAALGEALQNQDNVERLRKAFTTASYQTTAEFTQTLAEEAANWKSLFETPEFEALKNK